MVVLRNDPPNNTTFTSRLNGEGNVNQPRYDVSIVLALHREGKYLLRTLQSLREATSYAAGCGLSTELVAVLDQADEATISVLRQFDKLGFAGFQELRVSNGSLGPTRNMGISISNGKYIWTCDGDDLVSYNVIAEMHRDAERRGPFAVFFPQYVVVFGDHHHQSEYLYLGELTAFALTHTQPFISRLFAHRGLFELLTYSDVPISDGYAFEDWHFSCELIALGYSMHVTDNTILFYRRRTGGLLNRAERKSIRQIPPSRLFHPKVYLRRSSRAYEKIKNGSDLLARFRKEGDSIVDRPVGFELVAAANRIDPTIDPERFHNCKTSTNAAWFDIEVGRAYYEICRIVQDKTFDDVFLFPYFGGGGAELYCLNIIQELYKNNPSTSVLLVFGEQFDRHLWTDQLLPCVTVVDLMNWTKLTDEQRDIVTLKLLQSCAPKARIHVRQSRFGERFFNRFRSVLHHQTCLYYRFGNVLRFSQGYEIIVPAGFQFISENLEYFSSVVADNQTIIQEDTARVGVDQDKWRYLPMPHVSKVERSTALRNVRDAPPHLLWASRIAREKRPSLLPLIARYLWRRRPDARIYVHGSDMHGWFDMTQFDNLPNLIYQGPFSRFEHLVTRPFAGFIYTSLFDGMPNVVLEAISMGLPVIAPDVGGVSEMIVNGETGILLASLEEEEVMAEKYANAIVDLIDDPHLRSRLSGAALDRLIDRHSPKLFAERLARILKFK